MNYASPRGMAKARRAAMRGLDVLVIEDDPDMSRLVCGLLRERGFVCRAAASIHGAWRAWRRRRHDVVLLDFNLGAGTAAQLWRRLAPACRRTRVLVLSADLAGEARGWAKSASLPFMGKPFDVRKLVAWIRRAGASARG